MSAVCHIILEGLRTEEDVLTSKSISRAGLRHDRGAMRTDDTLGMGGVWKKRFDLQIFDTSVLHHPENVMLVSRSGGSAGRGNTLG
jgi:hypothetical protein